MAAREWKGQNVLVCPPHGGPRPPGEGLADVSTRRQQRRQPPDRAARRHPLRVGGVHRLHLPAAGHVPEPQAPLAPRRPSHGGGTTGVVGGMARLALGQTGVMAFRPAVGQRTNFKQRLQSAQRSVHEPQAGARTLYTPSGPPGRRTSPDGGLPPTAGGQLPPRVTGRPQAGDRVGVARQAVPWPKPPPGVDLPARDSLGGRHPFPAAHCFILENPSHAQPPRGHPPTYPPETHPTRKGGTRECLKSPPPRSAQLRA